MTSERDKSSELPTSGGRLLQIQLKKNQTKQTETEQYQDTLQSTWQK